VHCKNLHNCITCACADKGSWNFDAIKVIYFHSCKSVELSFETRHQRYVGWGCMLNCFMLSSLPCFMLFADLLSLHLVTFLMFLILVHVTFFSCRCMLELKFANYYRAASSPLTGFLCSIV